MAEDPRKTARNKKAFQGPGTENSDGLVEKRYCIEAGLHDDAAWGSLTYKDYTVGDLMRLSGFHERSGPLSDRSMKLTQQEMGNIIKALELKSGMNYYHPEHEGEYACDACCTCW